MKAIEGLRVLLTKRIPRGSDARKQDLASFFSRLPRTEAARMHWLLSKRDEPLRRSLERRLSPQTVTDLVKDLGHAALGREPLTAPENLSDEGLLEEYEAGKRRVEASQRSQETTVDRAADDERVEELGAEVERRGLASSEASDERMREIEHDRKLDDATQTGDYSGVDIARVTLDRRGTGSFKPLQATVYYRLLEIQPDGRLIEVDLDAAKGKTEREDVTCTVFLDDAGKRFIVDRKFFALRDGNGRKREFFLEAWWKFARPIDFEFQAAAARGAEVAWMDTVGPGGALTTSTVRGALRGSLLRSGRMSRNLGGRRAGGGGPGGGGRGGGEPADRRTAHTTSKTTRLHRPSDPPVDHARSRSTPEEGTARARVEDQVAEAGRARQRAGTKAEALPRRSQDKTAAAGPDVPLRPGVKRRRTRISGWTSIPERSVPVDPAKVADHAKTIRHTLRRSGARDKGVPGCAAASHSEKQQIVDRPNEPVGVTRPMCSDCVKFFQKEAAFRQQEQVVSDPKVTRVFKPDGSITEYFRDGSTLHRAADGKITGAGPSTTAPLR